MRWEVNYMSDSYDDIMKEAEKLRNPLTLKDTIGSKAIEYEAQRKIDEINRQAQEEKLRLEHEKRLREEETLRQRAEFLKNNAGATTDKESSKSSSESSAEKNEEKSNSEEKSASPVETGGEGVSEEDDNFTADELGKDRSKDDEDSKPDDTGNDERDEDTEDDEEDEGAEPREDGVEEDLEVNGDTTYNKPVAHNDPDDTPDLGDTFETEEFTSPSADKESETNNQDKTEAQIREFENKRYQEETEDFKVETEDRDKLKYLNNKTTNDVSVEEARRLYEEKMGKNIIEMPGGTSKIDVSNKLIKMIQEDQGMFISASKKDIVNGFLCVHLNIKNPRLFIKDEAVLSAIRFLKIENPIISVDRTLTAFFERLDEMSKKIDMYEYMISYLLAERTGARQNVNVLGINDFNLVDSGVLKLKKSIEEQYEDYLAKKKRQSGRPIR